MTRQTLIALAKLGVPVRLQQLRKEMALLQRTFQLGEEAHPTNSRRPKRRRMSAEARKAVSARMRRLWADKRKAQK